ncbi:hypothetical protein N0V86_003179 [Didymella sp. IMI 355093]|nr:hypothetical protein N0V86_003179 [Didymella sp. IMI 355093]
MPFSKLTFELIELIAEHLDQQGLNALIRVSSTTLEAAERYLYRDIDLHSSCSESSGWLITTLLIAENLQNTSVVSLPCLWKMLDLELKATIHGMFGALLDLAGQRVRMRLLVTAEQPLCGALGMLVGMTPNLQSFK